MPSHCCEGLCQSHEYPNRYLPGVGSIYTDKVTGISVTISDTTNFSAGFAQPPGHLVYPVVAQDQSFQQQHGKYQQTFAQFQPLYQGNTHYDVTSYGIQHLQSHQFLIL